MSGFVQTQLLFVSGFDEKKCGDDALCLFVLFVTECDAVNRVVKRSTRLQRAPLSFSHTVKQSHRYISHARNTRFCERLCQFKLNKRLSSASLLKYRHISPRVRLPTRLGCRRAEWM